MSMTVGERLAREFFERVWVPPHELDAIDELMTPDYRITTAGQVIEGREAFKAWVADMQRVVGDATNAHLEVFTNGSGDRVVSRWVLHGVCQGRDVHLAGMTLSRVDEHGRMAEDWGFTDTFALLRELGLLRTIWLGLKVLTGRVKVPKADA